jgi:hypothetical protein
MSIPFILTGTSGNAFTLCRIVRSDGKYRGTASTNGWQPYVAGARSKFIRLMCGRSYRVRIVLRYGNYSPVKAWGTEYRPC